MLWSAEVAEDDRSVRRVSDATRARIDELAGGWTIDVPARPRETAPLANEAPLQNVAAETSQADRPPPPPSMVIESATPVQDSTDPTTPTLVRAVDKAPEQPQVAPSRDHGSILPRTRGVLGDIRYVATVLFGVRNVARELQAAEAKQLLRFASRDHHLTTLARHAVVIEEYDHPAIRQARETLRGPEEVRAKHAAAVAAGTTELDRIRRDRETASKAFASAVTAAQAELAEVERQLHPLVRQAGAARRRAADLSEQTRSIGRQIAKVESRLASASQKVDPVAAQAEIAAFRADQQAIARDQPKIAEELDELRPQIDALRANSRAALKRWRDLEVQEKQDQVRAMELLEATAARRKADERGAADAEIARDKILLELGQTLHGEHPIAFSAQFGPIDQIDQEIRDADQRMAELSDMLGSVDRRKVFRGSALIALVVAAAGTAVWFLV